MPLAGTQTALAALIQQKLVAAGFPASDAHTLQVWTAVAEAVIEHVIANAQITVLPGIPVATAGSPSAQTGATTAPGSGTIL